MRVTLNAKIMRYHKFPGHMEEKLSCSDPVLGTCLKQRSKGSSESFRSRSSPVRMFPDLGNFLISIILSDLQVCQDKSSVLRVCGRTRRSLHRRRHADTSVGTTTLFGCEATRIGSGTQSGSRTRIRRIATAHSNLLKNRDVEFWCSICLDDDHALVVMNLYLF